MWPKNDEFCCENLRISLVEIPNSAFAVQEDGKACLTVGYAEMDDGRPGWFDITIRFCPFCGTEWHTKTEIMKKAAH
jgi:hypothetical protein